MKILHLISSLDRGGAENHLRDLVKGQRSHGHEVAIGFLRNEGELTSVFEDMGCQVRGPFLTNGYLTWGAVEKIKKYFSEFSPNILHTHMPPASLFGYLAGQFKKMNWVASLHNDERFALVPGQRWLGHFIYSRPRALIAISEAVKNFTKNEFFLTKRSPISVIPYGLDLTPFNNILPDESLKLRQQWGLQPGEILIGSIARLTEQKSLDTLITAVAKVKKYFPRIRLVLVGAGPLEQQLKNLAKELGIEDAVIFAGRRSDIPTTLKAMDIFVLPSIYEGLGLVLLEAMAAGTPIIASRVSAIPEIVEENMSGLLFTSKDNSELERKIRQLIEHPELRIRFAEAGKQRVSSMFALNKMVASTQTIYDQISRD